jgi:hypothetical protein
MPRLAVVLLALVSVLGAGTSTANPSERRVAVLQPDSELLRALSIALSPWGLETVRSDAALPVSSQPEAVQMASRLARELDVQALVWITSGESGSLLWVFDVSSGEVSARMLAQTPPFDGAAAAAIALSVKTVLRSSAVAPPEERLGSRTEPPESQRSAALEFGSGARWFAADAVDVRLELAGVSWLTRSRNLGLSLAFSWGPGIQIDDPAYTGSYRELTAGGEARFRALRTPSLSLSVALGATAHWATLDGTVARGSRKSRVERVNASLDLAATIAVYVSGPVYLGASAAGGYSLKNRRFLVEGTPIFSPWPLTATVEGCVGAELF